MTRPLDLRLIIIGALTAAFGCYLVAVGFSLLPPPSRINGPLWLSTMAGLAFGLGGLCVMLRGYLGMNDKETDVPPGAPVWAKLAFWGSGVAICCALAAAGTWVAFGEGARGFTMAGVINGPVSDAFGRAVFGTGAILTWAMAALFAWTGYRKIFSK